MTRILCWVFILSFLYSCAHQERAQKSFDEIAKELQDNLLQEPYPNTSKNILSQEAKAQTINGQRWCFVGDTGVAELAQKKVADLMKSAEFKCDRIYHLGDMVYPHGITSADDPELQRKFLAYHAPFKVPFYFVLGDHEYYSLKVEPWLTVAKKHENLGFPFYFYGHNVGGVCVVAGDTTPFYRGKLSDPRVQAQMQWFEKELPAFLKSCSFKIFMSHHSYATVNKERKPPLKEYKQPLRSFFERHILGKFDLIMSGHDHALAYVGNFDSSDQYISGAGGRYTEDDDERMDLKNFVGDKGPGLIVVEFAKAKGLSATVQIMALDQADFSEPILVFEKTYTR